ncbi:MAG: type II toxin-antitoxin system RelE/ParE family toxin [Calditrichaeota bacterium]|nr:MAG: type II toxin-antitoxin system RelE/ParE family toxin [Calditrichota bacterium]
MAYRIEFAKSVINQIKALPAYQRPRLLKSIEEQLTYEPLQETRNRKPLRPNPLAPWELRIGELRVFYEVCEDEPDVVRILAVGQKKGNRLIIAGKEIQL